MGNINEIRIEYTIDNSVHQERASLCVSNPDDYPAIHITCIKLDWKMRIYMTPVGSNHHRHKVDMEIAYNMMDGTLETHVSAHTTLGLFTI